MMIDPLHQFEIKNFFDLSIGGIALPFTNSALFMVLAVIVSVGLFHFSTRQRLIIPSRFQMGMESLYGFIQTLIQENIGPEGKKYFGLILSVFLFVLMGNLLGMIPYAFTFTSHIIVTFTLAMVVFL